MASNGHKGHIMRIFTFLLLVFSVPAMADHITIDDIHSDVAHLKNSWRTSQQQTYGEISDPDSVDPSLPNVLIIGDSISYGYTVPTRDNLYGEANVYRVPDNTRSSFVGRFLIGNWIDDRQYDVIHMNWGVWDLTHKLYTVTQYFPDRNWRGLDRGQILVSPWQYRVNLEIIVDTIRASQPNATLIWAQTTPVTKDSDGRLAGTEETYNDIAAEVMAEKGVTVNDLHAYAQPYLSLQKQDGVHWTADGSDILANEVAQGIREKLP